MNTAKNFGSYLLDDAKLKKYMSAIAFADYIKCKNAGEPLAPKTANGIAKAIKKWAEKLGATHYAHLFVPLTHKTAEKQTSFLEIENGKIVSDFSYKDLIKGETDASSFPSGGARATFEARGYTIWDYTSPVFVKEDEAKNKVVCIPTAFCGYNGLALDEKTPLLRALEALNREAVNFLHLLGYDKIKKVNLMTGIEQEYFLIDQKHTDVRTDLQILGRTLFGAEPLKSQIACSHYFGNIDGKISEFMHDTSRTLWKMGITAKHQHCEVAPCQYEIVPIFSPANIACDQNHVIMQTIDFFAKKYGFSALFAEKPFEHINGSGKHCNWSLETDTGINLFDSNLNDKDLFFAFFAIAIEAVNRYSSLIKLAASSRENDLRLGANEAPPAIVSVYAPNNILNEIDGIKPNRHKKQFVTTVKTLPEFEMDTCDRNRTSPFAYAGSKFEFRMLGSSLSASFASTCFCTMLAKVLSEYCIKLQNVTEKRKMLKNIVKNSFEKHKKIIFDGDNYSQMWREEAKKRGFETFETSLDIFEILCNNDIVELFESTHVLSCEELLLRKETMQNEYIETTMLEAKIMLNMARKNILPNVKKFEHYVVQENLCDIEKNALPIVHEFLEKFAELERILKDFDKNCHEKIKNELLPAMTNLRNAFDKLEVLLPNELKPFDDYDDILK